MANQETAYGLRPIGMEGSGPNSIAESLSLLPQGL